jgi:rod shape determining protein RodA
MAVTPYPLGHRGRTRSSTVPPSTVAARRAANPAWKHVDILLVALVGAISAFGVLMIYSSTKNLLAAAGYNPQTDLRKQAIFTVIGLGAMAVVSAIDYRRFRDWAPALYIGSVLLLLAVFSPLGHKSMGAQAWFQFGSYQVEPSEYAKIGLILALAAFLARGRGVVSGRQLLVVLVMAIVPFALIYKQPDLGSALVLLAVLIGMLLVAGTRGRHMVVLALLAVAAVFGVLQLGVLHQYQKDRLTAFLEAPAGVGSTAGTPDSASIQYNLAQSKATIADGGLRGKGLFKGPQTNLDYVPNQSTDFIFTAVGEQFGFFGAAVLLGLFALVIWRTWRTAVISRDLVGTLICVGVISMLVFQIFENVGMTMGIMPVAGITLPFVSYGGSSMVVDWVAIGLVLNVRMHRFG